jgi:hypothetical protein
VIHIVDIGSLRLPDGDVPYQPLLDRGLAKLTTFDPQEDTKTIGDGKPAMLHICTYPGWSSLLQPSAAFLKMFPAFKANARVVDRKIVKTHRLDDLDIEDIDFLKLDVQGSELAILEHGRKKLRECSVVQVEVPFLELYDGQPQLWQLDRELRQQGFVLAGFVSMKVPIEADALYVRYGSENLSRILDHCYRIRVTEKAA